MVALGRGKGALPPMVRKTIKGPFQISLKRPLTATFASRDDRI